MSPSFALYIHVPFCEKRCIYCDFYSTTSGSEVRQRYVEALCRELITQRELMGAGEVKSIYFGGGTPSQLSIGELAQIFQTIRLHYTVNPQAEITFEANPDDVTNERVGAWQQLGINRVSLGVQTFDDDLLTVLRRRHTAAQAREAVRALTEGGLTNVSIDLIYGLPLQSLARFTQDLAEAFALPITHLSSYALSVEDGTSLSRMVARGELTPADDELCLACYEALMDAASQAGFTHYEISNFAREGYHSRHNTAYWDGTPYLGCGPGAHSYDGKDRRWYNLPHLANYLQSPGTPPQEVETLSVDEQYDDLLFTALRTRRGLSLQTVAYRFGIHRLDYLRRQAERQLAVGNLEEENGVYRLTRKGIFISDTIISDLMV